MVRPPLFLDLGTFVFNDVLSIMYYVTHRGKLRLWTLEQTYMVGLSPNAHHSVGLIALHLFHPSMTPLSMWVTF